MGSMMNIHSVHKLQGLQNVVSPVGEEKPGFSRGTPSRDAPRVGKRFPNEPAAFGRRPQEASPLDNSLRKEDLESDPTVVHYPPFFPIATYQRLDLIKKAGGMEEAVQEPSQGKSTSSTAPDNISREKTTASELSGANGEIFAFHDQSTGRGQPSLKGKQPGSILDIEV